MPWIINLLLGMYLVASPAYAQIHPAEGSRLHYRIIGFSFPAIPGADHLLICIAKGNQNTAATFEKHQFLSHRITANRCIAEIPDFGQAYTWRIVGRKGKNIVAESPLYHFSTLMSPVIDPALVRLRVVKKAAKYGDGYVFSDKTRTLYDMTGKPVWFLPALPGIVDEKGDVRDLKLTRRGSVTFLSNSHPCEMNYDGQILWFPPNDGKVNRDTTERYHHQLTMLDNGNYMIMGNQTLPWEWTGTAAGDSSVAPVPEETLQQNPGKVYPKVSFGTIIEYDTANNIVWSWRMSDYIRRSAREVKNVRLLLDTHQNAFCFDKDRKFVYTGFKNLGQIYKIKYPEGTVTAVYGQSSKNDTAADVPFCHQHSCSISSEGLLYVFNNDACHPAAIPALTVFKESGDGSLKKVWQYSHPYTGDFTEIRKKQNTAGGNAVELPGGEYFVSMCNPFGNIFIVDLHKQLLWDAILEMRAKPADKWEQKASYRSSFITSRKSLEHLIWEEDMTTP